MFSGEPDLVKVMNPATMPPSFRVVPAKAQNVQQLASDYNNQPGVYNVGYPGQVIKDTLAHFSTLRDGGLDRGRRGHAGGHRPGGQHHPAGHLRPPPRGGGHEAGGGHQLVHPGPVHARGPRRGPGGRGVGLPVDVLRPGHLCLVHRQRPPRPQPAAVRQLPRGPVDRAVHRGRRRPGGGARAPGSPCAATWRSEPAWPGRPNRALRKQAGTQVA